MKLAFITNAIEEEMTGVGFYSKALIEAFIDTFPYYEFFFIDYKKKFPKNFKIPNKVKLLLINNILKKKQSLWFNYLPFFLKNYDFDYIFNLTGTPHFMKFPQKEIFVVHDLHINLYPQFVSFKTRLYNKLFFKQTLENSYKILVNSEQTKKEVLKYFTIDEKKIHRIFIPQVIKNTELTNNKKIDFLKEIIKGPYFLYVGNLDLRKNLVNLIKAFHQVKKKSGFFKYKLVLVGKPGFGYDEIKKFTERENNYKKDIIFTGYLSENDKYNLFLNCKALVYLSLYEGLGIPIFEAAYFGKPIISSYVPMATEIFSKKLLIVNPSQIEEIAQSLVKVINNTYPKSWIRINKKKASTLMSNLVIKKNIKQLLNFLVK